MCVLNQKRLASSDLCAYIEKIPTKGGKTVRSILSFALLVLGVSAAAVAAPPGFITIDAPGAVNGTLPLEINAHGDIVGRYFGAGGAAHGFLLSGGAFTLINIPGASGTSADGINSHGDI